jgi:copper chaperone NosL
MKICTLTLLACLSFTACTVAPKAIVAGRNNCDYCKMTVTDLRFACEILTQKGKTYIFDDMHCMISYVKENPAEQGKVKDYYLSDYAGDHALVKAQECTLFASAELHSPMGGNIAAFSKKDSMAASMQRLNGKQVVLDNLLK